MHLSSIDLNGLVDRCREPIFVLNHLGKLVFGNDAFFELVDVSPKDPAGMKALETDLLAVPEDLSAGEPRRAERPWRMDGKSRWLNVLFLALRDPENALTAVFGQLSPGAPPATVPKSADTQIPERLARRREEQIARWGFAGPPARSEGMVRAMNQARVAAQTNCPLAIIGETGVGKLALARLIHAHGVGMKGTFALVDCESAPPDVQRLQLLGRLDLPDLTSAEAKGLLRSPGPGTLVIRHPFGLAADLQREVSRTFQEPTNTWRLIVVERQPLEAGRTDGRLLDELFYLVSTLQIELPPLRARQSELSDYCDLLLESLRQQKGRKIRSIDPAAFDALREYAWPGNLRELESVLDLASQHSSGPVLHRSDLPKRLRREPDPREPTSAAETRLVALDPLLEEVERRTLTIALRLANGNKSKAADLLQISRPRLLRRIEQLGIT